MTVFQWFTVTEERPPNRKTPIYHIRSRSTNDHLGTIKWYGSWRQYCFFPDSDTVWSDGCLRDILAFMARLRAERAKR